MAEIRLSKLIKQFNIGLDTLVDFLNSKGAGIEDANELQKKGEAFDKEQATLPDNIKQRRQQELQDMYQKIQQSFQDNQQALQKASQEKMQAIQAKVLDAIKSVGQTNGYVYIMEDNSLPYISSTLSTDVTAQVKAKLGLK